MSNLIFSLLPNSLLGIAFQFCVIKDLFQSLRVCKQWHTTLETYSPAWFCKIPEVNTESNGFKNARFLYLQLSHLQRIPISRTLLQPAISVNIHQAYLYSHYIREFNILLQKHFPRLKFFSLAFEENISEEHVYTCLLNLSEIKTIQYLHLNINDNWHLLQNLALLTKFENLSHLVLTNFNSNHEKMLTSFITVDPRQEQVCLKQLQTIELIGNYYGYSDRIFFETELSLLPSIQRIKFQFLHIALDAARPFLTENINAFSCTFLQPLIVISFDFLQYATNLRFLHIFAKLDNSDFECITTNLKLEKLIINTKSLLKWDLLLNLKHSLKAISINTQFNLYRTLIKILMQMNLLQYIIVWGNNEPHIIGDAVFAFQRLPNLSHLYLMHNRQKIEDEMQFRAHLYSWDETKQLNLKYWMQKTFIEHRHQAEYIESNFEHMQL